MLERDRLPFILFHVHIVSGMVHQDIRLVRRPKPGPAHAGLVLEIEQPELEQVGLELGPVPVLALEQASRRLVE